MSQDLSGNVLWTAGVLGLDGGGGGCTEDGIYWVGQNLGKATGNREEDGWEGSQNDPGSETKTG